MRLAVQLNNIQICFLYYNDVKGVEDFYLQSFWFLRIIFESLWLICQRNMLDYLLLELESVQGTIGIEYGQLLDEKNWQWAHTD